MTEIFKHLKQPFRREGDGAIVDAEGHHVLTVDPDRKLTDDVASAIADRALSAFTSEHAELIRLATIGRKIEAAAALRAKHEDHLARYGRSARTGLRQ